MAIPVYDSSVLPCITRAYKNRKEATTRFLGNKAIAGDVYATLELFAETSEQAKAFFGFWRDDLNYGTNAFYIALPVFGSSFSPGTPNVLCRMVSDFDQSMSDSEARRQTIEIKIYDATETWFVVDDEAKQLIDDSGNKIITTTEMEI